MKTPRTVTYRGEHLLAMKEQGTVPAGVLAALMAEADALLKLPPVSVVRRRQHPQNGNLHAYTSRGPYWWPDPNTPDGLPYIRRDGEINPESQETENYEVMATRANTLALAAFYSGDLRYAQKAVEALTCWHLDEDTYMEPHARYAQAIPGHCEGRGIGLIDFCQAHLAFDAVGILEAMDAISPETVQRLKEWYSAFVNFMLTDEQGLTEDVHHNNHGTFFDVTALAIALFTGREALANKIVKLAYDRRHRAHVRADGAQPHELERTRAIGYSLCNLKGLSLLASWADRLGDARYLSPDPDAGVVLVQAAYDYILPHAKDPEASPLLEIHPEGVTANLARMAHQMHAFFGESRYLEDAAPFLSDTMLWRAAPLI